VARWREVEFYTAGIFCSDKELETGFFPEAFRSGFSAAAGSTRFARGPMSI
jgi:hypothetical protein